MRLGTQHSPVELMIRYGTGQEIERIAPVATPVNYGAGQFLFYEGHQPYGIFLFTGGTLELFLTDGGDPLGKPVSAWTVSAREPLNRPVVIGASLLAMESPYPLNGRAAERISGLFLDRITLKENPDIWQPLVSAMVNAVQGPIQ